MIHLHSFFAQINPQQFQECFLNWMKSIYQVTNGEVVALDGKTLRGCLESRAEQFANSIRSHWGIENSLHWGGSALRGFPPL